MPGSSSAMMSPSKPLSVVTRPRITYVGEQMLGDHLDSDSKNVGMFAGMLHQTLFTSARIQLIKTKCYEAASSPTRQFLQEWQRNLSIDEAVPVQTIIQILIDLKRRDAASAVEQMLRDDTFLDYLEEQPDHWDGPGQPDHRQRPARYPSDELHQSHPDSSMLINGAGLGLHQAQRQTSHIQSPQQDSFNAWQDADLPLPQTAYPTAATSSRHLRYMPHREKVDQPRNFTKSKLSLESESSTRQLDVDTKSLTWPQRNCNSCRQGPERHVIPVQDGLSDKGMDFHQSISPLRSVSPANTTATGERRPTTYGKPGYVLITYAKKTMGPAIQLGFALKNKGCDVKMDMKQADVTQHETFELFQKAKYVVVVYDTDYIQEKEGYVRSELHTRYIYQLMTTEYEDNGRQNMRFIPLIDDSRVPPKLIPSMFRHASLQGLRSAAYSVCGALKEHYDAKKRAKEQAKKNMEVSISRTTYTS